MSARTRSALAAAVLVAGCAAPPPPPPPGVDHPANPGAAEVPAPPPTATLATDADPVLPAAPPDETAGPQRVVPGGVQPAGGGMDDMPGMHRAAPTTGPSSDNGGSR